MRVRRRDISYSKIISHNQNNIWLVSRKAVHGCKPHGAGPQSEKKETDLVPHVWSLKFYKAWYKHSKHTTIFVILNLCLKHVPLLKGLISFLICLPVYVPGEPLEIKVNSSLNLDLTKFHSYKYFQQVSRLFYCGGIMETYRAIRNTTHTADEPCHPH